MENCFNPFTFPVASLLYRIARNMISNGIRNKKEAVAACSLLQNCILLLEQESHLELLFAANYLLAQLYMKDSFPDESTEHPDPSFDDDFFDSTYIQADGSYSSDIKKGKVWLASTREEKCRATISFVVKALDLCNQISDRTPPRSLSFDVGESNNSSSFADDQREEEKKYDRIVAAKHDKELALESRFSNDYGLRYDGNFNISLKSNAIAAYTSLAAISISKNKCGRALKYLKIALSCLETIPTSERPVLLLRKHAEIGMRIGDICLQFAHMKTFSYEDCLTLSEEDTQFVSYVSCNTFGEESSNAQRYIAQIDDILKLSSEDLLIRALSWYENSLDVSPADDADQENVQQILALTARLGNVRNELGLFYMDMASALLKDWGEPSSEEQEMWKKSYQYFEKGIEAFSVIDDRRNKALLYSNKARIMRMCAQAYGNSTRPSDEANRGQFIQPERIYFSKAFEFYQKSLSSLGSRSEMPDIWDQISYDLSGAYFKMACILQDNAPLSSVSFEEVSKEVQKLMMKSLHFCHDEEEQTKSPRFRDIRLRIGTIHRRIGSLYQYSLRNKGSSDGTKKLKSLSDLHYNKAYSYLDAEEESIFEYLTTLNEHVALNTQLESRTASAYTTIKRLKCALTLLLRKKNISVLQAGARSLQKTLAKEGLVENLQGDGNESKNNRQKGLNCSVEIVVNSLSVLDMMFKKVLKDLVQTFSKNPKITVVEKLDLTKSKRMYEVYLRRATERTTGINKLEEGIFLFNMIAKIIEKIRGESSLDND